MCKTYTQLVPRLVYVCSSACLCLSFRLSVCPSACLCLPHVLSVTRLVCVLHGLVCICPSACLCLSHVLSVLRLVCVLHRLVCIYPSAFQCLSLGLTHCFSLTTALMGANGWERREEFVREALAVSYTHLTLPTIPRV